MFKYLIVVLVHICYIRSETLDFDRFAAELYSVGDTTYKMVDEVNRFAKYCSGQLKDIANAKNVADGKTFLQSLFKGDKENVDKMADVMLSTFDNIPQSAICLQIKSTNLEKVLNLAKELDKFAPELKKVRDQFTTALTDIPKPENKLKAKDFTCLVKLFIEKTGEVLPEKDGLRDFGKSLVGGVAKALIALMEAWKGKANKTCELPPAAAQPSKYKSLLIPLFIAGYNIHIKDK